MQLHRTSTLTFDRTVFTQVMFLAIDLKDEEFSKPMLAVYGLDTAKPVVSTASKLLDVPT